MFLENCLRENRTAASPYTRFDKTSRHIFFQNIFDAPLQIIQSSHAHLCQAKKGPIQAFFPSVKIHFFCPNNSKTPPLKCRNNTSLERWQNSNFVRHGTLNERPSAFVIKRS